jgi:hypothetical protein
MGGSFPVLACNIQAIGATQRPRYDNLVNRPRTAVQDPSELSDGYLAKQIPGARLVIYPEGGHLWVGHDIEVQKELTEFLRPKAVKGLAATSSTSTVA